MSNPYAAPESSSDPDVILSPLSDDRLIAVVGEEVRCGRILDLTDYCFHTGKPITTILKNRVYQKQICCYPKALRRSLNVYIVAICIAGISLPYEIPLWILGFLFIGVVDSVARRMLPSVILKYRFGRNASYLASRPQVTALILMFIGGGLGILIHEGQLMGMLIFLTISMFIFGLLVYLLFASGGRRFKQVRAAKLHDGGFTVEGLPRPVLDALSQIENAPHQ